ncbi:hypothetical protein BC833DRAFT_583972 [Globomyces pollinis-pini]|nr:hypothetical protein BC833DRAFT_583972 [Globomyces pollinis-pini]
MKYTNNDVINYLQSVKLKILHVQSLRDRKQQLLTALADSYLTLLNDYSRVVSQLMSFLSCNSNQLQIENKLEYFKLLLSTISLKLNSLLASTNLALTKDQVYSQLLDCRCEMENAINLAQNLLTPLNKQLLQYDNLGYEFQQIVGQYTKLSNDLNMLEKDISRLTLS